MRGRCSASPTPSAAAAWPSRTRRAGTELERFEFAVAHGDGAAARARLGETAPGSPAPRRRCSRRPPPTSGWPTSCGRGSTSSPSVPTLWPRSPSSRAGRRPRRDRRAAQARRRAAPAAARGVRLAARDGDRSRPGRTTLQRRSSHDQHDKTRGEPAGCSPRSSSPPQSPASLAATPVPGPRSVHPTGGDGLAGRGPDRRLGGRRRRLRGGPRGGDGRVQLPGRRPVPDDRLAQPAEQRQPARRVLRVGRRPPRGPLRRGLRPRPHERRRRHGARRAVRRERLQQHDRRRQDRDGPRQRRRHQRHLVQRRPLRRARAHLRRRRGTSSSPCARRSPMPG